MELKRESITLSSLVRRALNPTCSILICFSREGGGVLAPGFLCSLYRRVQGILRSLLASENLTTASEDVKENIDAPIVTNSLRHSGNIPRAFVSTGSSMFSLIFSSAIFRGRG